MVTLLCNSTRRVDEMHEYKEKNIWNQFGTAAEKTAVHDGDLTG
jgi:hypothetical protein